MIEFREANHVSAAATAVAVEEIFVGVHQEAWFVVSMQRAEPHPSAAAEWPRRAPIMRLQIAHERNLLFQLVESLTIHGLLASNGRIRQTAMRSQATMVGADKKCAPMAPAFTQQHNAEQAPVCPSAQSGRIRQARRIFAVRRCLLHRIAGGDALTGLLSTTQAEGRRRRQPIGQDREGLPARTTDSASHPDRFVLIVVALAESPSMADDRGLPADGTLPRQEGQRDHPGSMLSFASGSAIKRITAGVKAAADRRCQVSI